ncbi:MAG: hypothetical protein AB7O59_08830 [Pirellulales bacterium]
MPSNEEMLAVLSRVVSEYNATMPEQIGIVPGAPNAEFGNVVANQFPEGGYVMGYMQCRGQDYEFGISADPPAGFGPAIRIEKPFRDGSGKPMFCGLPKSEPHTCFNVLVEFLNFARPMLQPVGDDVADVAIVGAFYDIPLDSLTSISLEHAILQLQFVEVLMRGCVKGEVSFHDHWTERQ